MGKQASNADEVSPVNGVTSQQIMPHVGDMSTTLDTHLPICLLH